VQAALAGAQVPPAALRLHARRQVHDHRIGLGDERAARGPGPCCPLLRLVDAEVPPVQLVAVEPLGSGERRGLIGELDECESSRTAGGAIGGDDDVDDFT
jgi:hypothetical protein